MTASLDIQKCRESLWHKGILAWKFHAGQLVLDEVFHKQTDRLFFGDCARQFGKTRWAVAKCLETALNPKIHRPRIKYASAFLNDLEEFTVPAFEATLADCPRHLSPVWREVKKKFIFPRNRAEIKLVGLDKNPNGIRGGYLDLMVFEEAGLISRLKYLFESVVLPMTTHRPWARIIMITTPPESPAHESKHFKSKAKMAGSYVLRTIDDNPLLTPERKAEIIAEYDSDTARQRELYCKWIVDTERAIVPEWREEMSFELSRDEFFPFYFKYEVMDIGGVHQTAALFCYYHYRRAALVVEDELIIPGQQATTKRIASGIREKRQQLWLGPKGKPYDIRGSVADNDNPILLRDLQSETEGEIAFNPTGKDSLHAMVNEVRIWVGDGRVIVHPRCEMLRGCLESGVWNKSRTKFDEDEVFGHFDALAALVYAVRNVDTKTNPIPATHGIKHATHYIKNGYGESQELKRQARKLFRRSNR